MIVWFNLWFKSENLHFLLINWKKKQYCNIFLYSWRNLIYDLHTFHWFIVDIQSFCICLHFPYHNLSVNPSHFCFFSFLKIELWNKRIRETYLEQSKINVYVISKYINSIANLQVLYEVNGLKITVGLKDNNLKQYPISVVFTQCPAIFQFSISSYKIRKY